MQSYNFNGSIVTTDGTYITIANTIDKTIKQLNIDIKKYKPYKTFKKIKQEQKQRDTSKILLAALKR